MSNMLQPPKHLIIVVNRFRYINFIFVYFIFMSLIVLYFLHSTSVLSFYIDVVLTLSIQNTPCYAVNDKNTTKPTWDSADSLVEAVLNYHKHVIFDQLPTREMWSIDLKIH